ncbi:MAG: leucine-rich repeat domain-containing protein [Muribaculaceae bacterium]|nr:leucine-rich repeat domain-containing protein [Muribaculaceae bacterium]
MKKLLFSLLGVLIALPSVARDFEYEYEGQTLKYTVIDEDAKTVRTKEGDGGLNPGNKISGDLIIPSEVKNGDNIYTVTEIGGWSFQDCSGLVSVYIPSSVTTIGDCAFDGCTSLRGDLIISDYVTQIGMWAFNSCKLTSVIIGNSVTNIRYNAFKSCRYLTSVVIGKSVEIIDSHAFDDCTGLIKSAYPNTISNPFSRGICISYPAKGAIIEDGLVYGPDKSAIYFAPYTLKGEFAIPQSVENIGERAFSRCRSLTSVVIGNAIETIGSWAFNDCSSLEKAEFASVEHLCNIKFADSSANPLYYAHHLYINGEEITDVIIPESVTAIGNSSFVGCSGLTSVVIGNAIETIGSRAFDGCNGLIKSAYPNTISNPFSKGTCIKYPAEGAIIEDGFVYGPDKSAIYFAPLTIDECTIPASVNNFGVNAFYGCDKLNTLTVEDSETAISFPKDVFNGIPMETLYMGRDWTYTEDAAISTSLKSVSLGTNVKSIPAYAFNNCKELTAIELPNFVQTIGSSAFSGCTGMTSVEIPNSVKTIGSSAFYGCTELTSMAIPDGVKYIGASAFGGCTGLTSVKIGSLVETIGSTAFSGCSKLASVEIPVAVKSIGASAFSGCNGLTSVKASWDKPLAISEDVFSEDTYTNAMLDIPENTIVDYLAQTDTWGKFSNLSIDDTATKVFSDDVFKYRLIENPDNREAVLINGDYSSMTEANIPYRFTDESDSTNPVRYNVTAIGPNAFKGCTKLKAVNINSRATLTSIGESAFDGCTGLTSFTMPAELTDIKASAFYNCTGLTEIKLNDKLTTIGESAFYNCKSLASISIPESVTNISEDAFSDNSGLKYAEFASIEALCNIKFTGNVAANPLFYAGHLYIAGEEVTEITIPESVKT